ncbi:hypothetical protein [Persicobacter diffluens]|uniref:Uncharacterized protein n=1 Tax=Persicobacter diffluens TaxID=981 RepID=A0AAN5AKJ6_9BACT|nr:hypothetical protein PEDI_05050 [Persicobacter diffluens]
MIFINGVIKKLIRQAVLSTALLFVTLDSNNVALINGRKGEGSAVEKKASQRHFSKVVTSLSPYPNVALMDSDSRFLVPPTLIVALIFLFRFLSRKNEKERLDADSEVFLEVRWVGVVLLVGAMIFLPRITRTYMNHTNDFY